MLRQHRDILKVEKDRAIADDASHPDGMLAMQRHDAKQRAAQRLLGSAEVDLAGPTDGGADRAILLQRRHALGDMISLGHVQPFDHR